MAIIKPNPGPQTFVLQIPRWIQEILYGGARGGGKTFAGQMWMVEPDYYNNPRYAGLVVRKNADDLAEWIERAKYNYRGLDAVFTGKPCVIRFPNGGYIRTGHLKDQNSLDKYQGQEYQKMLIEELTQIPSLITYLKFLGSSRSTVPGLPAQVFCTTNPGGSGHLWVKERFVDPAPPNKPFKGGEKNGTVRIFIPSTIDDNPKLRELDPGYVNKIDALEDVDPSLYKAWRFGDWNVFVGQVFSEFMPFNENGKPWHVIPELPFNILDPSVKRYIGMDWGFGVDPAVLEWIAVTPPNDLGVRHYYIYREMTDKRTEPEEWLRRVADVVSEEPIDGFILPGDAYFHKDQANTIADRMEYELKRIKQWNPSIRIPIVKGVGLSHSERVNRQMQLHSLLAEQVDGMPGLQIVESCRKLIKTIPALPYSDTDPETVETKPGTPDHWYDAATYGLYHIADRPNPKPELMSEYDMHNQYFGGHGMVDFQPEFEEDDFTKDWRNR